MQTAVFRTASNSHDAVPLVSAMGLRYACGNLLLALSFFTAIIPAANALAWSIYGFASAIWIAGAASMGVLSFVRRPPRSTTITMQSMAATAGMLVIPCLMRPTDLSDGLLGVVGSGFELFGIVLTVVARLYMGRSFGILPANRGIVSNGPFTIVRHPVYIGWLILSIGYALVYPSALNVLLVVVTLPFMVWRIEQEEGHLSADPAYLAYSHVVRFRLWPGLI
jgi:protein-S-isoprenylcysteine O-methyltransferase Ste14